MLNPLPKLKETPSQTGGPYVHIGLVPNFCDIEGVYTADLGATMLTEATAGERIVVTGRVIDGSGAALTDTVVEIWQADAEGGYAPHPIGEANGGFTGFGRQASDERGVFRFETIKPGPAPGPDGKPMAPHITLWITARGINIGLHTRLYFGDEAEANDEDFILNRIADARRRQTLIATREEADGVVIYRLDIHLQGENETVFFDI